MDFEVVWNGTIDRMVQQQAQQPPVRRYEKPIGGRPTPVQDAAMELFERHDSLTRRQLMALTGRTHTSVSCTLDRLLRLGLIGKSHKVKEPGCNTCWAFKVAE